jgi:hypothetical protein
MPLHWPRSGFHAHAPVHGDAPGPGTPGCLATVTYHPQPRRKCAVRGLVYLGAPLHRRRRACQRRPRRRRAGGDLERRRLEHPDGGTSWSLQVMPSPAGAVASELRAVSCSSPGACTAVGADTDGVSTSRPLAERWDGTRWRVQAAPSPAGAILPEFAAVSCASPEQTSTAWPSSSRKVSPRRGMEPAGPFRPPRLPLAVLPACSTACPAPQRVPAPPSAIPSRCR